MEKITKPKTGRKRWLGIVVNDKTDKTIKVQIEQIVMHPIYKKQIRRKKNILVHDEKNEAKIGDKVEVIESRPISKLKRWRLVKIIERAK